jgi:superoxide reductase
MITPKQVYRCNVCGNIVEVLHTGGRDLVCCEQPMELLQEKVTDAGLEKHVPFIGVTDNGIKVKVSDIPHPMEEKYFIDWVEIIADSKSCRIFLGPGEKPEADFDIKLRKVTAREYCSIHGLWKSS